MNSENDFFMQCFNRTADSNNVMYLMSPDQNIYKICHQDNYHTLYKQYYDVQQLFATYYGWSGWKSSYYTTLLKEHNVSNMSELLNTQQTALNLIFVERDLMKFVLNEINVIQRGLHSINHQIIPSEFHNKESVYSFNNKINQCYRSLQALEYHSGLIMANHTDAHQVINRQQYLLLDYKLIKECMVFGYVKEFKKNNIIKYSLIIPTYLINVILAYLW